MVGIDVLLQYTTERCVVDDRVAKAWWIGVVLVEHLPQSSAVRVNVPKVEYSCPEEVQEVGPCHVQSEVNGEHSIEHGHIVKSGGSCVPMHRDCLSVVVHTWPSHLGIYTYTQQIEYQIVGAKRVCALLI